MPHLAELTFSGAAIDSRLVQPGELFVALIGERSDGHDYVDAAFGKGHPPRWCGANRSTLKLSANRSVSVLATANQTSSSPSETARPDRRSAQVALHRLASNHRAKFDPHVIGISGSVGKTSTKEATASVLQQHFNTLKTPRSYNSESTMPLTILQMSAEHQIGRHRDGNVRTGRDRLAGLDRPTQHRHRD